MTEKSDDVYHDYVSIVVGLAYDETKIKWRLDSSAMLIEYSSWESEMERGFARCRILDSHFDGLTALVIAHRRVDSTVSSWWREEMCVKGITWKTSNWEHFKQFLRTRYFEKFVEMDKADAPIDNVNKTKPRMITSEEKKSDVDKDVVKEFAPLSGLNMQLKQVHGDTCVTADRGQRWNLFQAQCMIKGKACKLMVDSGSYCNGISKAVVEALGLSTWRIPEPRHVEWVNSCGMIKITHNVRVQFTIGDYVDEVECDVLPLEVCGLLLGRPWQYDRNVTHAGRANTYSLVHDGKQRTLKPMRDEQIQSDVELVVRKEKLRKGKPKSGLATPQPEEHDARSVRVDIVSAMFVDDKHVLVSDKPVEVQPLIDEKKEITVCVDTGVQTDESCANPVPVPMVPRVYDRQGYVSAPVRRFVGAAVRMHTGNDERVRQLCGPGITHLLPGRARNVHVQQHKVPARVEKKQMVAPRSKLMWRRKEVHATMTVSSRASLAGGCGEEGKQDLKTEKTRADFFDITPPFRADPHALGTTLFEGGTMIWARRRRCSPISGLHQVRRAFVI